MLVAILKLLGFKEEREFIREEKEKNDCKCCEGFLENYSCMCKEEQIIDFEDGTEPIKWFSQGSCDNWDCSNCH